MKPVLALGLIGVIATPAIGQYPPGYGETPPPAPRFTPRPVPPVPRYTPRPRYTPPPSPRYTPRPSAPATRRTIHLPPMPGFVVGNNQQAGNSTIVEWVPRGQTVHRHDRIITLTTFAARPGVSASDALGRFVQLYRQRCPRAMVASIVLPTGAQGARIDCLRHPNTGRAETIFVRALSAAPVMALVQYSTTYITPQPEAARARQFLGMVSAR